MFAVQIGLKRRSRLWSEKTCGVDVCKTGFGKVPGLEIGEWMQPVMTALDVEYWTICNHFQEICQKQTAVRQLSQAPSHHGKSLGQTLHELCAPVRNALKSCRAHTLWAHDNDIVRKFMSGHQTWLNGFDGTSALLGSSSFNACREHEKNERDLGEASREGLIEWSAKPSGSYSRHDVLTWCCWERERDIICNEVWDRLS